MRPLIALFLLTCAAHADHPVVEDATARRAGDAWNFSVTLTHPDTGWDHYADGWRVETPDGTVLGFRELLHPHINEQPFTRSLSGVALPEDLTDVRVRPRCNLDGWSDKTYNLQLP